MAGSPRRRSERMNDEYDTKEKLERTDTGYRLTVESKRGTGTRDQDTVKVEYRSEDIPEFRTREELTDQVKQRMNELRENQPDEDVFNDE